MSQEIILINHDGFEIVSFKREQLGIIGARAFLAFTGYMMHQKLSQCVTNNPSALQKTVQDVVEDYQKRLFHGERLRNEKMKVFISQNLFSPQGEHRLYIMIREKKLFAAYKRMLLKIIT